MAQRLRASQTGSPPAPHGPTRSRARATSGRSIPHHMLPAGTIASSTAARALRLAGDQRQRPCRRSDLADGLRAGHRLLLSRAVRRRPQPARSVHRLSFRFRRIRPVANAMPSTSEAIQRNVAECVRRLSMGRFRRRERRPDRSPDCTGSSEFKHRFLDLTASRRIRNS